MNTDIITNSMSCPQKKKNDVILNVGNGTRTTWFGQETDGGCGDMHEKYVEYECVHLKRTQIS